MKLLVALFALAAITTVYDRLAAKIDEVDDAQSGKADDYAVYSLQSEVETLTRRVDELEERRPYGAW